MRFEPNSEWRWIYSAQRKKILLRIGRENQFFVTMYGNDTLNYDTQEGYVQFNVDDSSLFFVFFQCVADLNITQPEKLQLALNAVTANRFFKEELINTPKLMSMDLLPRLPKIGEVFSVVPVNSNSTNKVDPADLMVIRPGEKKSLCMVLYTGLTAQGKEYNMFELVVVENRSLIPYYKLTDEVYENLQRLVAL